MLAHKDFVWRFLLVSCGFMGLLCVYVFQHYLNLFGFLTGNFTHIDYNSTYVNLDFWPFLVNKAFRYLLNDSFTILIIYGLFFERKYLKFSFYVMLFGLLVLLPLYVFLYLNQPEGFSSMIGHLHRVVMNPVLMMLLIPAFYFQQKHYS